MDAILDEVSILVLDTSSGRRDDGGLSPTDAFGRHKVNGEVTRLTVSEGARGTG